MIPPGSAELVLAVAKGLIKFSGHLDRLLAEKVAVQSPLPLKLPVVDFSPGPAVVKPRLRAYLQDTSPENPGPLGQDLRKQLADLMSETSPDLAAMRRFFALAYPDDILNDGTTVQPDASFLQYLRDTLPGLRETLPAGADSTDPEKQANYRAAVLAAAFYVDPGADARQLGYPVRVGLLVVDVLAEFGAENTQLFVRDEGVRSLVKAVLERFAKPDLESFDTWSPFLRHVLSATLNGALDARQAWAGSNPWLEATLQALADAREAAGAGGDDYLLGLLEGEGYSLFLSQALVQAAGVLDDEHAPIFQQIAAEVLRAAAPLVQAKPKTFGAFFNEHWTDLLHAALVALDKHGNALLAGQSPLLQQVLLASIKTLADTPGTKLLTRDTLFHLTDAALGAIATHPDLWKNGIDEEWLSQLVQSVLKTIGNQGIVSTFSLDGLESILRDASARFAEHPEWIVKDPGLFQVVVGGILKQLSAVGAFEAKTLADAAVQGALNGIAAHPEFIGTDFQKVVADFAGQLAALVARKSLTALQASDIIEAAADAALLNPELFASASKKLAGLITDAVLRAGEQKQPALIAGATFVAIVQQQLVVFARRGRDAADDSAIGKLEDQLVQVLSAGLARAEKELGRRLTLQTLPATLAALTSAWLRGEVAAFDPENPLFKELFAQLAERASAD
jgi:hypothetical protein